MTRSPRVAGALIFGLLAMGMSAGTADAQSCTFSVNVPTVTFGNLEDGLPVTATSSSSCSWSVSSSAPWLTGGASAFGPSTSFSFFLHVDSNTTGATRTGSVSVNGQPAVSVMQGTDSCVTGFDPAVVHTTIDGAPRTAFIHTTTADCAWNVKGFPIWVAFPNPPSGIGSRAIGFGFMSNTNGTGPRSTDISYSGRSIHIDQDGPSCVISAAPTSQQVSVNGGTFAFNITGAGTACDYTAEIFGNGITVVSGGTGTAPATLTLRVAPNSVPYSRTATVRVQNAIISFTQDGSPIALDRVQTIDFSYYLPTAGVSHITAPETVRITNTSLPTARWTAAASQSWIALSSTGGASPGTLSIGVDTNAAALLTGSQNGTVDIRGENAPDTPYIVIVRLYVARSAGQRPYGVFETPRGAGAPASGAIPVTGWASDDMGIARITISRAAAAGEGSGEVYIGDAVRVRDARPDVGYSNPEARLAGWGYMLLTNVLPGGGNGTFTFFADVTDVEGQTTRFGPRTVTIDNAHATRPFGTIDEPAQGQTVSGTLANRGWVLTPPGKAIPVDGSTIKVYIDGVLLSPVASYNRPRPDVKAFFPGLANSDGPEARLSIDTTTLSNGVHTIAWGVIDDAGVAEGIGSRYFTVQNGAGSVTQARASSRAAAVVDAMPALGTDVWSRGGVDEQGWAVRVETEADGGRTIHAPQGQRLEVFLDPMLQAACGTYDGHLRAGDVASPLPIGASLDPQRGIFRWQPGVEFAGVYAFMFVHHGCDGVERRIPVRVVIDP